jgi:PAS domain S-box-containing protein
VRIATRLSLAAGIPALITFVVALALLLSYGKMRTALEESRNTRRIMQSTIEINNLVDSYILYHEDRPRFQFFAERDSLTHLLRSILFHSPEENRILEDIRHNSEAMGDAFLRMVSIYESDAPGADSGLVEEAGARLAARVAAKSRTVLADALSLEKLIQKDVAAAQRRLSLLILFMTVVMSIPLTTVLIRLRKGVGDSLSTLRARTEMIAGGDLHQRIAIKTHDEIGELSRAFEWMTERLKNITVSRDDLNREVEERRRAEDTLRLERDKLDAILENVSVGVGVIDTQGTTLLLNPEALRIHGFASEREGLKRLASYRKDFDLYYPDGRVMPVEEWPVARALRGEYVRNYEVKLARKGEAESVIISYSAVPVQGPDGRVSLVVFNMADITSLKKAAEVLARDRESLERIVHERTRQLVDIRMELERARRLADIGALAATVAHELRSPLAAINAAVFNLRKRQTDAVAGQKMDTITRKVNEVDRTIDNLLSFSGIRAPDLEEIKISELLDETASSLMASYPRFNARLTSDLGEIRDLRITVDPVQIGDVFRNILLNAFQATEGRAGLIQIRGTQTDNTVTIEIEDNGGGIDSEYLDSVFNPFFTTKPKGTGLGLSLCKEFVGLHKGDITIRSEKDQGTTVVVKLPTK